MGLQLYPVLAVPNDVVVIDRDKIFFVTVETDQKGVNQEKIRKVDVNDRDDSYHVTFGNYPCITNEGTFLIFKYRLGIKKMNLANDAIECFNFIDRQDPNQEVSSIALTPDNSKIIVGTCESTCKTGVKNSRFRIPCYH